MELKCSLPRVQDPTTCLYPEPDQSSSHPPKSCVSMHYYACVKFANKYVYLWLVIVVGVCGYSLAVIAGSNPAGGMSVCPL